MSRPRLGKRERMENRKKWAAFRAYRDSVVETNLSNPKPEPVKYASLGDLGEKSTGKRARVSQLIIRKDPVKQRAFLEKKYRVPDSSLYDYSKF